MPKGLSTDGTKIGAMPGILFVSTTRRHVSIQALFVIEPGSGVETDKSWISCNYQAQLNRKVKYICLHILVQLSGSK